VGRPLAEVEASATEEGHPDPETPHPESLEETTVWWETVKALLARGTRLAEAVDGANLILARYRSAGAEGRHERE